MRTVLIGSPGDMRVDGFQHALAGLNHPPAVVVPYPDLITGQVRLEDIVSAGTVVRIESPGKDEAANTALLALGLTEPDEEDGYASVDPSAPTEKGDLRAPRQWYRGMRAFLRLVSEQLALYLPHRLMNHPDDLLTMFDKRACHARLQTHGVPVPAALPPVRCFDELATHMAAAHMSRVFVKLAHGSSASGVVAYQTNGRDHHAVGAVEMVTKDGATKLYNTRQMQTYRGHSEVARLIDTLCQHRVHVEQWIPKGQMDGRVFDLRVLVIAGQAAHTVARLSRGPVTNLHLLNERRPREAVMQHLGPASFDAAMQVCENAMLAFPNSLYAGVDLLVTPDLRRHYVLEVNAFGDLLHETFYDGMDPYTLELERMRLDERAHDHRHA